MLSSDVSVTEFSSFTLSRHSTAHIRTRFVRYVAVLSRSTGTIHRIELQRTAKHPVNNGSLFVLYESGAFPPTHSQQTCCAVFAHAGQQTADGRVGQALTVQNVTHFLCQLLFIIRLIQDIVIALQNPVIENTGIAVTRGKKHA